MFMYYVHYRVIQNRQYITKTLIAQKYKFGRYRDMSITFIQSIFLIARETFRFHILSFIFHKRFQNFYTLVFGKDLK